MLECAIGITNRCRIWPRFRENGMNEFGQAAFYPKMHLLLTAPKQSKWAMKFRRGSLFGGGDVRDSIL